MSRTGNCWENAVSESFFATPKAEEAIGPDETKPDARRAIAADIHRFYTPLRLHSSLGHWSPDKSVHRMQFADPPSSVRSAALGPLPFNLTGMTSKCNIQANGSPSREMPSLVQARF
jgi:transposase InsO family protein